jgi:hypothetical protein
MVRYIPTLGFCWMLLWVSTTCAPLHNEPEALSEHRYRVSLHVSDTLIFLGASGLNLPQASEVVVRVPDAQDQPVDGLPVVFSAEPSWTQNVSFAPAEARTRHGEARTTFEANTTGVVHIMAHVDHVMREARMTIQSRLSPVGGGA